ncbi:hypothetical protein [Pseudomonas fluorescens]|uniref:Uncharacterized protein n=1 Tax=Pseudomonas fluorescens TaxID=294 RepID=A0A0F4SZJ4_PSEFL|nr:hypothetical protein [Pseudomonas fluorescens]KJZ37195.1 hypothetical protein VC34_26230 [Pseudomonas fluorescens]
MSIVCTFRKYGVPIIATAVIGALTWIPVYALIMSLFDIHAPNAFHWAIMAVGTALTACCLGLHRNTFAGMVRNHQNALNKP